MTNLTGARPTSTSENTWGTHEPLLSLRWCDPASTATGYLVIDSVIGGLAGGGIRMRPGATKSEAADLARTMSLKTALHMMPIGGAKAAIDYDPGAPDSSAVLLRFLRSIRSIVADTYVTAEDMGLTQDTIDEAVAQIGLDASVTASFKRVRDAGEACKRIHRATRLHVDGLALPAAVGGYGIARAVAAICAHKGWSLEGSRAVVQGFGSMGASSALYLQRRGCKVVGIVDADGGIINQAGLDVERLLEARLPSGVIDRGVLQPGDALIPRDDWLSIEAEILIPAAMSYVIDESNCDQVSALVIAEAANCPTSETAESVLTNRGVVVIPDFVANGAAAKWWWATIVGEIDADARAALNTIGEHMSDVMSRGLAEAGKTGVTLRAAMTAMATEQQAKMRSEYGEWDSPFV